MPKFTFAYTVNNKNYTVWFLFELKWFEARTIDVVHSLSQIAAHQASLSFTISWSLVKCMSIELVIPSKYLVLHHHLLLLPSIFPSLKVFSNESDLCIRWPKNWSFSFSISPSNEYSGLISFTIDWFDLLTVQGTLKSLLQYHSWKASVLQHSPFFMVQLSHPYRTTEEAIALTIQIFAVNWCLCF